MSADNERALTAHLRSLGKCGHVFDEGGGERVACTKALPCAEHEQRVGERRKRDEFWTNETRKAERRGAKK